MRLVLLTAALLLALTIAACGDDDEDVSENGDDATSDAVQLVAGDFQFAPTELSFSAGEKVQITFTNTGQAKHNFMVEEMDVSHDVDPNDEITFDFTAPDHDVSFHCHIHPDTMKGTITITDAAAGDASPTATDDDDSGGGGGYGY